LSHRPCSPLFVWVGVNRSDAPGIRKVAALY
jgi:hypothetical protein